MGAWRNHFSLVVGVSTFLLAGLEVAGASLGAIKERQQARLTEAVERLNVQRQAIQAAQLPLAEGLQTLRAEAVELKEQLRERRRLRDTASLSLEALASEVTDRRRELDYVTGDLLGEFMAAFKSALSPAELPTYGETLRQHDLLLEKSEGPETDSLDASLRVLEEARRRLEALVGGKMYAGQALGPDGRLVEGQFLQVGPLLYFSGSSDQTVGWVEETTSLQARVRPLAPGQNQAVREVLQEGNGLLPVDPTLGDALAFTETREGWRAHLEKGGVWVVPILLFAALALCVSAYKFVQIFSIRAPRPMVVHEIVKTLRQGNQAEALALASSLPQPAAGMLTAGVEHAAESIDLVEEVMFESILGTQPKLERFLNVIAVTAATAPLLGLLGTVTGIIRTFRLMEVFGAGDPKRLISGISEALITTELGLVLAIPSLIAHAILSRRVAGVLAQMEKLSVAMVNGLSRREMNGPPPGASGRQEVEGG